MKKRQERDMAGKRQGGQGTLGSFLHSVKGKIVVNMNATVFFSLMVVGLVSVYLNYSSTIGTLRQTMSETAQIAAERTAQQLEAYKNISREVGCVGELSSPVVKVEEKKAIIDERVKAYGLRRGNVLQANGDSLFDGNNYSDRVYFQEALKGNTYVSEPLVSKVTGELSLMVAAPLWQAGVPNSTVAGVVYFVPEETFLNDIVSSLQVSANGSAYILNKEGYTIAHPNMDNVKNRENTAEDAKTDPGLKELAALEQKMVEGENGFGRYEYGGVKKFLAYAPIEGTDGWSIGINAKTSDFLSSTFQGIFFTVVLLIAAMVVAAALAFRLGNQVGKPIKACADRLSLLSRGDLTSPTVKVQSRDETAVLADATGTIVSTMRGIIQDLDRGLSELANGNFLVDSEVKELYVGDFASLATSMYRIIDKLTDTLGQIRQSADQVSSGSEQVSGGAQALSQGATEQASAIQELAATINEISNQVKQTAKNAIDTNEKVGGMGRDMEVSNQKMQEMIRAMDEISAGSQEIGKIIKTIEDIAFQTNILALNAAVEAARAGAAGKGFAVVADEVRNLANKSSEASKNTASLIENSLTSVANGTQIAGDAAASMMTAVQRAEETMQMVAAISQASDEEAQSISQITQGIDQISSVVQTNSATAEESAAASEELSGQATILKNLIGQFKLKD